MKDDKQTRQHLIEYIKTNELLYSHASFEEHSLTRLVIMKTELEIKIAERKKAEMKK